MCDSTMYVYVDCRMVIHIGTQHMSRGLFVSQANVLSCRQHCNGLILDVSSAFLGKGGVLHFGLINNNICITCSGVYGYKSCLHVGS